MLARSSALLIAVAVGLCTVTVDPDAARAAPFPTVTWRMAPEVARPTARPGQRITYTVTLRRVRNPAAVAAWLCAPQPARAACQRDNTRNLENPFIVDDLNIVGQHAVYDNDVRGFGGTSVGVRTDGPSAVIVAHPATVGPATTTLSFRFSVTVRRGTRPGSAIRNMALVMFAVTDIRPGSHPLSNCPLDLPLFLVAKPDGNLKELAPSPGAQEAPDGVSLAGCVAATVVRPKDGATTGFGGMAGHVGNLPAASRHRPSAR